MFAGIWSNVRHDQKGIQSLVGLIYMAVVNVAFSKYSNSDHGSSVGDGIVVVPTNK